MSIQGNQAGVLRKRWLMAQFLSTAENHLRGVYFGIGSKATSFDAGARGYTPLEVDVIARIRTDLDCRTTAT